MTLKDIGEFGFIEKISRGCFIRSQNILKAIGDDAAAFTTKADEVILITTDMLVERVHFLRNTTSGFNLGYKSLAVNLSDIAAMGGTAKEAFVSIAIPEACPLEYLEDLYRGIKSLAAEFDINILGGDTTGSKTDLIINISVVGAVPEKEILYRHTAQPGDIIFSTGCLGDSRAGLQLILNKTVADSEELKALFNAHILPWPYLEEGRFLAHQGGVHAAIDVSDGLSSDLGHIIRESNAGARLYAEKIPVSKNLQKFCTRFDADPLEYALGGGEDYMLLCTISPDKADSVARDYLKKFGQPIYPIGEITDSGETELVFPDGRIKSVAPSGWNHFKIPASRLLFVH
ncbi:thiamine-phosphate kinase [Desulfonema magnum]|uniref:Thiamine-monophosphate kinase n=1 Tax=Desulfonema magnum TaxID=45655 RepID=A0A975BH08_9BACT|nr:thiamine-phosphate kinase [Desulfonema magnum]QTA85277.1 Thiamine-monophosphate kinase [Desulfonema magnum]